MSWPTRGICQKPFPSINRRWGLQPHRAEFHKILADLERQSGHAQPAIEHYQAAIRLQPDFTGHLLNLVPLLAQTDKSKEAIAAAEKAIALARASGQPAVVDEVEERLKHYQTELRRPKARLDAESSSPDNPADKTEMSRRRKIARNAQSPSKRRHAQRRRSVLP